MTPSRRPAVLLVAALVLLVVPVTPSRADLAPPDEAGAPADATLVVRVSTRTPTVAEPGALVRYDVAVSNTSPAAVTLTSLTDQAGDGSVIALDAARGRIRQTICALAPIAPGATFTCSFDAEVTGTVGDAVPDVVHAVATDGDGAEHGAEARTSVVITAPNTPEG